SAEMVVFEGGKRFYRFSGNILSWNRAFRAPQMGFLMGIIYPRFPAFTGRILAVEGCGFSFPALWPKWLPVSIYSKGNIGISQNESMEAAMSEHASKPGLNGAVHKLINREDDRIRRNTATHVRQRIDAQLSADVRYYGRQGPEVISKRISELDREWHVDRALMTGAGVNVL